MSVMENYSSITFCPHQTTSGSHVWLPHFKDAGKVEIELLEQSVDPDGSGNHQAWFKKKRLRQDIIIIFTF